jgi:hypothetical protein
MKKNLFDFRPLYERYPQIIAEIPDDEFTSHKFILRLAQKNQAEYINALYYHRGKEDPFRKVHSFLAKRLHKHRTLIKKVGVVPNDPDIFGEPQPCARWRKVH